MSADDLVTIGGRLKALRVAEKLLNDKAVKTPADEQKLTEIRRLKRVANLELKKAVREVQQRLPI